MCYLIRKDQPIIEGFFQILSLIMDLVLQRGYTSLEMLDITIVSLL